MKTYGITTTNHDSYLYSKLIFFYNILLSKQFLYWFNAILFFVLLDTVTTVYALQLGIKEANPLIVFLYNQIGWFMIPIIKIVIIGGLVYYRKSKGKDTLIIAKLAFVLGFITFIINGLQIEWSLYHGL